MGARQGMRAGRQWLALAAVVVAGACSADPGAAPPTDAGAAMTTPDTSSSVAAGATPTTTAVGGAAVGGAAGAAMTPSTVASSTGSAPTPTTAAATSAAAPSAGLTGRGITGTTIKLGLAHASASFRSEGPAERPVMQSIIDEYNRLGGIAGRKIIPVWYENSFDTSKTESQRQQERCVSFTEDAQVFAVYPNFTTSENEAACLLRSGTLLVATINAASAPGRFDDESYQRLPNLWAPATPSANRIFSTMVEQLSRAGYFDPGARIGVIYTDEAPSRRAMERSFKPAMKAKGLTIAQEAAILSPVDVKDLAPMASQIQSAVLRFRTAGITHVIIPTGLGSIIPGQFMRTSQEQNYKPRYGLESGSLGVDREPFSQTSVREQLHGAVYMGWDPYADVRDGNATVAAQRCNEIMKKVGAPRQDPRGHALCDMFSVLEAGISHATDLSLQGFAAGMRRAGRLPLIRTFETDYATGRHDGASLLRMATYDFSCQSDSMAKSCWRYDTPPIPF